MSRPDWVDVLVAVKPAGLAVSVSQGHLATVGDHLGLALDDGAQPSLQAGLELARHQGVVGPRLAQDGEVDGEEAEVEEGGDGQEDGDPGHEVAHQLPITEILPGQQPPVVLGQQVEAEEAGVDPDILHTETQTGQKYSQTLRKYYLTRKLRT